MSKVTGFFMRRILLNGVNMKIAAATSVVIFTLLVSFIGVYSWFETVRNNESLNEDINVFQYGKFSKLSFHQLESRVPAQGDNPTSYSFDIDETGSLTYDWDDETITPSGNTNIILNQYDPMHRHQPCLALIELNDNYNNNKTETKITISTDTIGFLGALENKKNKYSLGSDSELLIKQVGNVDYYPLSSVASFIYRAFSKSEYNTWINGKSTYDINLSTLTSVDGFVTVDNTHQTSSFANEATIYSSGTGNNTDVKYIAFVIDYYFDAIESIYTTFLGDSVLESNTYNYVLHFICDWEWNIL